MNHHTVLIVGAGLAGSRAAETLRAEGFDGRILLVGEEPVAPYERPALSKGFLAGTRDEASLLLRKPAFWNERRIELLLGRRVAHVDPLRRIARTNHGDEMRFDQLIVATGARPRRLKLAAPNGVHQLRTLADARLLRADLIPGARLVVIGGGFVGAEVASTARARGLHVTIVEAAPAPLSRALGDEVGRLLAKRWQNYGIDVRLGTGVASIRADASGRVASVLLTDGAQLRADAVLIGVGVEAAKELLPARPALHIQTCGDVVGPGHWTAAALDGVAAARHILGMTPPEPQPPYVWSDQFGLRLQIVGTPRPNDRFELDGTDNSFAIRYLDQTGQVRAALLANRPTEAAETRRRLAEEGLALAA